MTKPGKSRPPSIFGKWNWLGSDGREERYEMMDDEWCMMDSRKDLRLSWALRTWKTGGLRDWETRGGNFWTTIHELRRCEPHSGDNMVEWPNRGKAVRVQYLENGIGWDRTEGRNGARGWMMDFRRWNSQQLIAPSRRQGICDPLPGNKFAIDNPLPINISLLFDRKNHFRWRNTLCRQGNARCRWRNI